MANGYSKLNADNAFIWRITHIDNLPWILVNGLHCSNSPKQSPAWVNIGSEELIDKRRHRLVPLPPGGALSDYVPFYFTPFSPMMYNIHTGRGVPQRKNEEIIILVSTLHRVRELGHEFLFTNQHAYLLTTEYYDDLKHLDKVDWALLQNRNFKRNPDDPSQFERYQAEALIHRHMPVEALIGVICYTDGIKSGIETELRKHGITLDVKAIRGWYF
jgi:hypothetical protein